MLKNLLEKELQDCPLFEEVRGKGLMLGIALKSENSIGPKIGLMCLQRGVYIGYYGHNNNVLRIHPHLNIDESTTRSGAALVIDAIKTFASDPHVGHDQSFASFFTE